MRELYVFCEGPTEQGFCKQVLELTAPSKRIISLLAAYRGLKAIAGPDIAEYIGLVNIRRRCALQRLDRST